jgi:hypothetical protein
VIALLSAWLIGYALGRVWRPARKQKPARFAYRVPSNTTLTINTAQDFTINTAQDSTK